MKAMKLGEVQRSVEEREKQLALKESKISSIQSMIEEYEEEIKAKEKSCDEVKMSLTLEFCLTQCVRQNSSVRRKNWSGLNHLSRSSR